MNVKVQAQGFDALTRRFEAAAASIDEAAIREDVHTVGETVKTALASRVERLTGMTAEDVTMVDAQAEMGRVRVDIGARGGKGGRAFILNFLEFGTVKQPAEPAVRPTIDSDLPPALDRLRGLIGARLRRAFMGAA